MAVSANLPLIKMIITSYIIKKLLSQFVMVMIVFLAIIWLGQLVKLLDLVLNKDLSLMLFIKVIIYSSATYIPFILPIVIYITVVLVYKKLALEGEIVTLQAAGKGNLALLKPVLIVALLLMLPTYVFWFLISPLAMAEAKDIIKSSEMKGLAIKLLNEKTFITTGGNTTYMAETENGNFKNFFFFSDNEDGTIRVITANTGVLAGQQNPTISLKHGRQHLWYVDDAQKPQQSRQQVLHFSDYSMDINTFINQKMTEQKARIRKKHRELMLHEMFDDRRSDEIKIMAHQRITLPLLIIINAVIAVIIYICGYKGRGCNNSKLLYYSIAVMLLLFISIYLPKNNILPSFYMTIILMYLIPILLFLWSCLQLLLPTIKMKNYYYR